MLTMLDVQYNGKKIHQMVSHPLEDIITCGFCKLWTYKEGEAIHDHCTSLMPIHAHCNCTSLHVWRSVSHNFLFFAPAAHLWLHSNVLSDEQWLFCLPKKERKRKRGKEGENEKKKGERWKEKE